MLFFDNNYIIINAINFFDNIWILTDKIEYRFVLFLIILVYHSIINRLNYLIFFEGHVDSGMSETKIYNMK